MANAGAFNETPLMTAGIVGGGAPKGVSAAGASAQGTGIIAEQTLKTANIVANARPTGAGAMGVPQPAAVMNPKPVNSTTLAVAAIVQATPAAAQAASATSGPGAGNSATLKTAGILASAQPGSEATVGIPQPAAASGTPAVNSATLGTAGIVGGASKTTAAAGAASGTAQITVALNSTSTQGAKSEANLKKRFDAGGIFVLATSLWLFL
jgi:hypothetical protein